MSEPTTEGTESTEPVLEFSATNTPDLGTLLDFLLPAEGGEETSQDATVDGAAAAGAGQDAAPGEGAGAAGTEPGAPPAGADGQPAVQSAGAAATGATAPVGPAETGIDAASLAPKWGEITTALEENTVRAHQKAALADLRAEHPKYFEAIAEHPRALVGRSVPRLNGEGEEVLRDSEDAKEWQEAVKTLLSKEVRGQTIARVEADREALQVLHGAIELFQNNPDLIPGVKGFDKELADRFTKLATPYEHRIEGKLTGYTIPVQPLVDQIRQQITAERASRTAEPAPVVKTAQTKAVTAAPVDPPQAGIPSKAGNSSDAEDYETLWGTLGLPNLRI